jgi:alpha-L-rhamnosidase
MTTADNPAAATRTTTRLAGPPAAADWLARPITLPGDAGAFRQAPAPLLRRVIHLEGAPASARLHVTALGLHDVRINGLRVSADLLAPGWTPYRHRLLVDSYDVTGFLRAGENVIAAALGDGWYRGRLGFHPGRDRCTYGTEVALLAQLELTGEDGSRRVVATDGEWQASTGAIRAADLYDGATVDLRGGQPGWDAPGFDGSGWQGSRVLDVDVPPLEARIAPPVRVIATLAARRVERGPGVTRLDGGQNVAGWVRLRVRGRAGTEVRVRHAEVLEADGSLHVRALRSAKATDTYVLVDGGPVTLEPAFTFHGFRYAEVETDAELLDAEIVAISSDTPRRSAFECSDARLNRLHENVVWSQRDNFVSVPTDCPQRDERLGWTGDAQAFAATGSTLFDAESFWRSWLRDLALEQHPVLGVPSVVPNVVLEGPLAMGRAGWADAATIVPWAVYESYGDPGVLEAQLPSMRRLAGPGRTGEPALGGEGGLGAARERVLRPQRAPDGGGSPAPGRRGRGGSV